jgi:hypothetical protein
VAIDEVEDDGFDGGVELEGHLFKYAGVVVQVFGGFVNFSYHANALLKSRNKFIAPACVELIITVRFRHFTISNV